MSHQRTTRRMTIKRAMLASSAVAALTLTGCSMGSDSGTSAASSATSAAASAASNASGSSSAAPSTDVSTSPVSESSSPSSASSSVAASSVALPADTQLAKAAANKLSFSVPKSWTVVDGELGKQDAVKKQLEPVAKKSGMSPEKYVAQMTSAADVLAIDATGAQRFNDNINVLKVTRPSLAGKAQLEKELNQLNAASGANGSNSSSDMKVTTGEYSRITTPAGAGEQMEYTLTTKGVTVHGVSMVIPNGSGSYSMLTVSASAADKAAEYAKTVAETAQKM